MMVFGVVGVSNSLRRSCGKKINRETLELDGMYANLSGRGEQQRNNVLVAI